MWISMVVIANSIFLFVGYFSHTGFLNPEAPFQTFSKEKDEIIKQIESVYFRVTNGVYRNIENIGTPENFPFYNSDLSTIALMKVIPIYEIKLEPREIQINHLNKDTTETTYNLLITKDIQSNPIPIRMIVKKIGDTWKLDAQKFYPLE